METLWYAEMEWNGRWIRVTEGWKTRDDAEWHVGQWKQAHDHRDDNFRYRSESVQTEPDGVDLSKPMPTY